MGSHIQPIAAGWSLITVGICVVDVVDVVVDVVVIVVVYVIVTVKI